MLRGFNPALASAKLSEIGAKKNCSATRIIKPKLPLELVILLSIFFSNPQLLPSKYYHWNSMNSLHISRLPFYALYSKCWLLLLGLFLSMLTVSAQKLPAPQSLHFWAKPIVKNKRAVRNGKAPIRYRKDSVKGILRILMPNEREDITQVFVEVKQDSLITLYAGSFAYNPNPNVQLPRGQRYAKEGKRMILWLGNFAKSDIKGHKVRAFVRLGYGRKGLGKRGRARMTENSKGV